MRKTAGFAAMEEEEEEESDCSHCVCVCGYANKVGKKKQKTRLDLGFAAGGLI